MAIVLKNFQKLVTEFSMEGHPLRYFTWFGKFVPNNLWGIVSCWPKFSLQNILQWLFYDTFQCSSGQLFKIQNKQKAISWSFYSCKKIL